ncbi:putative ABC transport system substrate-binding protein [Paenibacillus shirakamiensis]|uniref:ABC transport system substrate-binding protein n=1 Tax=Paenibacillus shirakamiensis TaxID=1265935 RepID=A0ABS4JGS4_9BACL|nr:ABC transporter substrate-binding protein [Paenibacillus shirakamiensis]MBP2000925.1 putative ABC transport system substrate-binding protein [Paenibacillus shirakamiensis]
MRKRLWGSLVLSAVLVLTAAGCSTTEKQSSGNSSPEKKTYKIAVSQIVEHPSLDAIRNGFLAALKDNGITEGTNLKLDVNNAQGDQTNNLSIAQKIQGDKDDLVLAITTPTALVIKKQVTETPILFAGVSDPLGAKLIKDLDKPEGNITGASDMNPEAVSKLAEFIAANFPKVKTVGIVLNTGESNAVTMAKHAEEAFGTHNIKVIQAPVTNTSEVKQAAESLVGRADALYVTLDNTVVEGVNSVISVANAKHIPFFASDRDTVEKGAFATVGFKYYDHGYQVGQMAVEILKNGKKPSDLKVTVPEKLDFIMNLKAAKAQGIEVTDAMKSAVKDQKTNIIE